MNVNNVSVKSHGFGLWKKMEAVRGRVPLQIIAEEIGLNLSTVRKFLAEPEAEIKGATISYAWIVAQYFRVRIGDLITGDVVEFDWHKEYPADVE